MKKIDAIDIESRRLNRRNAGKVVFVFVWIFSLLVCLLLPERQGLIFFWWWLFITGILCIYATVMQRVKAYRAQTWLETAGTVREFRPGGYPRAKDSSGPEPAMLQYEYTVWGRRYIAGEAISPEDDRSILRKDAYPPGTVVTVHYDPEKPWISQAVSWGVVPYGNLGVLVIGVVLVVCCIAALFE